MIIINKAQRFYLARYNTVRVEERLRQKMVHQEMMTIREDIWHALDSMQAKIDRCIAISREVQGRDDSGEDAA